MEDVNPAKTQVKVYRQRFAILATVTVLNISNAALWINYSPVATTVANFYNIPPERVNYFSVIYLIINVPFSFLSTFVINKVGLKYGIYIGAILNTAGGVIRGLGTSNIFDSDAQFAVSITGQVFAAMAQSFLLFIPTKVSQLWFPENQRAISTTVLAMSNPLGIVIAQGVTPFVINDKEENVPTNNYIWMVLAIISMAMTIVFVTRAKPKTPPSFSAEVGEDTRPPYLTQLKKTFTSLPYMLLLLTLGGGVGIFSTIATLTQQMLCPLGYSDVFGGIANVVMVLLGFVGSGVMGVMIDKTKKFEEVTKFAFGAAAIALTFMLEFYIAPNQKAGIIIFAGIFGFFGVGAYPVGLELGVEITYPVEETISTAFIFLSGQIQGILAIVMIPALAREDTSRQYLNVCDSETDIISKEYSIPVMIILVYMAIIISAMILFMKPKYHRIAAEAKHEESRGEKHENDTIKERSDSNNSLQQFHLT